MNNIRIILKLTKSFVVTKRKINKVNMSYIEDVFREHNYVGNITRDMYVSKRVEHKYEIVFISLASLYHYSDNIYYKIHYANGDRENGGIGCASFIHEPHLFLRTIENHAR